MRKRDSASSTSSPPLKVPAESKGVPLTEIDVSETATAYFSPEAVPSSYANVQSHAWLPEN